MLKQLRKYGVLNTMLRALKKGTKTARLTYHQWRCRKAPVFSNPTPAELGEIEKMLVLLGVEVHPYSPDSSGYRAFCEADYFPPRYHGGRKGGVWDEKLLEHWIACERLDLFRFGPKDVYVDVAAASSPWAKVLRERERINAYAVDLCVGPAYEDLSYYRQEDATNMSFDDGSICGVSLQCAYEMFIGDADIRLIAELGRVLRPGGKAVILPLYMHTHYCAYTSPDCWGKGHSDVGAREYVRHGCLGIQSSRKYDAEALKRRVLDPIVEHGLSYTLLVLRNKEELGRNIYCHFILEVTKPQENEHE